MFAQLFPADPWAPVLDCLLSRGYADETISGDIQNKKSMALETLIGDDGKIGLSFVHVLSSPPKHDDIYAYWLRLSNIGGTRELRLVSKDTGFSGRWPIHSQPAVTFSQMEAVVLEHNLAHTRGRQNGTIGPLSPLLASGTVRAGRLEAGEYLEFQLQPSKHPLWLAPSRELRIFLNAFYNQYSGKNLHSLGPGDASDLAKAVRTALRGR